MWRKPRLSSSAWCNHPPILIHYSVCVCVCEFKLFLYHDKLPSLTEGLPHILWQHNQITLKCKWSYFKTAVLHYHNQGDSLMKCIPAEMHRARHRIPKQLFAAGIKEIHTNTWHKGRVICLTTFTICQNCFCSNIAVLLRVIPLI